RNPPTSRRRFLAVLRWVTDLHRLITPALLGAFANPPYRSSLKIARQMLCPLGGHAGIELLACAGDDRERVSPRERPACVDHDAGVAPVSLAVITHGVEGGAPSAADDLDVLAHIAAGAHRPDDIVDVGGIDIVV